MNDIVQVKDVFLKIKKDVILDKIWIYVNIVNTFFRTFYTVLLLANLSHSFGVI